MSARLAPPSVAAGLLAVLRPLPRLGRSVPAVVSPPALDNLDEPRRPYAAIAAKVLPKLQVLEASPSALASPVYRPMVNNVPAGQRLDLAVLNIPDAPVMGVLVTVRRNPLGLALLACVAPGQVVPVAVLHQPIVDDPLGLGPVAGNVLAALPPRQPVAQPVRAATVLAEAATQLSDPKPREGPRTTWKAVP